MGRRLSGGKCDLENLNHSSRRLFSARAEVLFALKPEHNIQAANEPIAVTPDELTGSGISQ